MHPLFNRTKRYKSLSFMPTNFRKSGECGYTSFSFHLVLYTINYENAR